MSAKQTTTTETTTVTRKRKKKDTNVVKKTKTNKSVGATVSRAKPKRKRCPTCGRPL